MNNSRAPASIARLAGKGGRYHHGRLRGSLMIAAAQILEREGEAGLTMRALADRADVSRTAPYRHFAGKQGLLAAVAAQGFKTLDGELAKASDAHGDFTDRQLAMGKAYLAFARRYAQVFRLMFIDPPLDATVRKLGDAAVQGRFAPGSSVEISGALSLAAYALVHGLALIAKADTATGDALELGLKALSNED
ncbi:MAG: TetR/AcrR family transcriptional regulator [Rhodospirillales bacterium]